MNHISEEYLIEFADGTLGSEQLKAAELHLAECAQCREELEMHRSLSILLEKENIVMAPPAMSNMVMQQIDLHQHIMLRKAKSRKTARLFAVIMLGILSILISFGVILDPGKGLGLQMPDFVQNIFDYVVGMEFAIKNPLLLYIPVSVVVLLSLERIIRSVIPQKVTV